MNAKLNRAIFS